MKKYFCKRYAIIALVFIFNSNIINAQDYDVFYLGGQSNMVGHGKVSELTLDYAKLLKNVMIYDASSSPDFDTNGSKGIWTNLLPGHGKNFYSDGEKNFYSEYFGVELSFALELIKQYPNKKIAIIKYARSGTTIEGSASRQFGCWDPYFNVSNGINQYDHFLETIRDAFAVDDIDGDGEKDRLIPKGIIWMQGESDAEDTKETALKYSNNLKDLMLGIRAALRNNDLPVVIGRISDSGQDYDGKVWNYGNIVREQQAQFVNDDRHAILVTSTDKYGYSDKWHYDTQSHIDLGKQFALSIIRLIDED